MLGYSPGIQGFRPCFRFRFWAVGFRDRVAWLSSVLVVYSCCPKDPKYVYRRY